jgi:hypothetical protein
MGFLDKVKDAADAKIAAAAVPDHEPSTATEVTGTPADGYAGPRYEYETEVLTSMVGRDKLRTTDLDAKLRARGAAGWELVSCNLDADLKGSRDGHLLIFKRQKG